MATKTYSHAQLLKESGLWPKDIKDINILRNAVIHSDIARTKQATETEIRLQGLKTYYNMRETWSNFLRACLFIILFFNISLVILVGKGILKYNDEWFLRLVLTTNLADIIGLVYLIVKFLFSNQDFTTINPKATKEV